MSKSNLIIVQDYNTIISEIQNKVKEYLIKCNIKALVIGVSGGLDSGINCALLSPICKELNIPLYGRYIHIETNKQEEKDRADMIGKAFCTNYKAKNLTEPYHFLVGYTDEPTLFGGLNFEKQTYEDKIRRGNIKARLRMIYLYNIAQKVKGIVVDNDNMTEHLLGFWTINGDVGDITPLASLLKTQVYELSKTYINHLETDEEKNALQAVIDCVPTDGLGITSSDVEQFGVKSYDEVDRILINYINFNNSSDWERIYNALCSDYSQTAVDKVINRHLNSEFKRNHPHKIIIT